MNKRPPVIREVEKLLKEIEASNGDKKIVRHFIFRDEDGDIFSEITLFFVFRNGELIEERVIEGGRLIP